MIETLSPLIDFVTGGQASVKIIVTLLILVFGHLSVRAAKIATRKYWIRLAEDVDTARAKEREEVLKYSGYILDALVIIIGLVYLNSGFTGDFFSELASFLPRLMSALLVGILGIIGIELLTKIGENFLERFGAPRYLKDAGFSGSAVEVIAGLFKGFLYLILLQISLTQLGVGDTFVKELVNASSWALALLIAGLLFYGFKDLFQNFAAGIYLKNSRYIRPGEEVSLGGDNAEINDISLFSTSLSTEKGRTTITPNSRIMNSDISVKRTKSDIETLEEVGKYFSKETSEKTASASLQAGLEILGWRINKGDIELKDLEDDEAMEKTLEKITEGETRTDFVEEEKVRDLGAELKTWFNDGALAIPKFDRSDIFPESGDEKYALAVGVEGDEILLLDPGRDGKTAYYVQKSKLRDAMRKAEGKQGYHVIAPEGTTAFWRLKNDLIYSDRESYDELSKTLETRLTRIMRQGRIKDEVMPESVRKYLESWRKSGDVTRLWSPEQE